MELQKANGQQEITKKENMVKFVHYVAEMEKRIFTLRETAKQCRKECRLIKENAQKQVTEAQNELEKAKQELDEIIHKGITTVQKKHIHMFSFFVGEKVYKKICSLGCISVLLSIVTLPHFLIYFFLIKPWFVIFLNRKYARDFRRETEANTKAYEKKKQAKEATVHKYSNQLEHAKKHYTSENNRASNIEKHAGFLERTAQKVEDNLMVSYELSVIPPNYRNMICTSIIDDVFINDKADTMREATLLCDTELRHADLIGKLSDISFALQRISTTLQSMNFLLCSINQNIITMRRDIFDISLTLNSIEAQNMDLLVEAESTRYATESIKESMDNINHYIELRKGGLL